MAEKRVSLADAKARLSELTTLASEGEAVIITKRNKPVVRLSPIQPTRVPVNRDAMRRLTDAMRPQSEEAADFIRHLRDGSRY